MARTAQGRTDVRQTRKDAWKRTLELWKPGIVLFLLTQLPLVLITLLASKEMLDAINAPDQNTSRMLAGVSYLFFIIFNTVLYVLIIRLFLVGRNDFLKLPFARLAGNSGLLILKSFQILFVYLLALLPAAIIGLALAIIPWLRLIGAVLIFIYMLFLMGFMMTLVVRFMPALMGTTVNHSVGIRDAWRRMKGHTRSIIATLIPAILFSIVLVMVLGFFFSPDQISTVEEYFVLLRKELIALLLLTPLMYLYVGYVVAVFCEIYKDEWSVPLKV
ncbi:MAG: hypothetical protein H3C28_15435 [Sphingomonadales bacterium]|nr:hypothetical protein [Sphingomonadales bacterium]